MCFLPSSRPVELEDYLILSIYFNFFPSKVGRLFLLLFNFVVLIIEYYCIDYCINVFMTDLLILSI